MTKTKVVTGAAALAVLDQMDKASTAIVAPPTEAELAQLTPEALEQAARELMGNERVGAFIGTAGAKFRIGNHVLGNTIAGVILGTCYVNALRGSYEPGAPYEQPRCFATAWRENELAPDPKDVHDPIAPDCAHCPLAAFGTADKGKGRACRRQKRLAIVPVAAELAASGEVEASHVAGAPYIVHVPPSSTGVWAGYVQSVMAAHHRPVWAMVTAISLVPNQGKQGGFGMEFAAGAPLSIHALAAAQRQIPRATELLRAPFPASSSNGGEADGKSVKAAKAKAKAGRTVAAKSSKR